MANAVSMHADAPNGEAGGVNKGEGLPIQELLNIMKRLRDPKGGCPWDLAQDFHSIAKHTLEEAYEVVDAIERGEWSGLKGELGDLLFQVVFYAQMASERGWFDFDGVAHEACAKMIRRHPHIFKAGAPDAPQVKTADDQVALWENLKAAEQKENGAGGEADASRSALDGITLHLPALPRAVKIQHKAAKTGFDWKEARHILDKLDEEIGEVKAEMELGGTPERLADEVGDILFVVANLARRLELDPETCLRQANHKFTRRFQGMEELARNRGKPLDRLNPDEQDALWRAVKAKERQS